MSETKCVVPISGGKDSQACLRLATQTYAASNILGLFCDTKFEHPKTYAHIQRLQEEYGVRIETVCNGSVPEQIKKYKKFPTGIARFCTYNLKIAASRDWYLNHARAQGTGFEVWIGVRSAESSARAKRYAGKVGTDVMPMHEFMPKNYPKTLEKLGVLARLPILEWQTEDVFAFLEGKHNPLYDDGFDRVGCFPCLAAGDTHKERAFEYDVVGREHLKIARELEPLVGRSVFTSKRGQKKNDCDRKDSFEGCSICSI